MAPFDHETTVQKIVAEYGLNGKGKTFLITGPSEGGLGGNTAIFLAKTKPAHIILAGRTESKIAPVIKTIREIDPNVKTSFVQLDLTDNTNIRRAAEKVNTLVDRIDVLVNNAGIMAIKNFTLSKDGVELQFAANHLGHFLFTNLIIDKIIKAKGIVINVSSAGHFIAEANSEDPNFNNGKDYDPWTSYSSSKSANILFTVALQQRYKERLYALTTDPGVCEETKLQSNNGVNEAVMAEGFAAFEKRLASLGITEVPPVQTVTLDQGTASAVLVALDPSWKEKAPVYVRECNVQETPAYTTDEEKANKLWEASEKLVGQKFGP